MLLIDGSGLYFERVGREYLARCTVGLLRAKQKEGAPQEELLALARKAIKLHDFCDSAQNWLREIRNEHSPDARCHRIIITGEFRPDGSSANLGFYRNYTVLATNLDQAVNYIR